MLSANPTGRDVTYIGQGNDYETQKRKGPSAGFYLVIVRHTAVYGWFSQRRRASVLG
jgi:hypothetical protein